MKTNGILFVVCLLIVGFGKPAFGHHSTSMFNMGKPTTLEGTVKNFEWANPHVYLHLDVSNAEGKSEEWVVEIHSPAIMLRRGYTKDYFKPGDKITVVGGQMKDGTHMMRLLRGNKPDGTKFYGDDFAPGTTPATSEK
jgi:hypothetical protein